MMSGGGQDDGGQDDGEQDGRGAGDDAAGDGRRVPGGGQGPQGEPDPEMMEMLARFERNMEFFIGYEVPGFAAYVPDTTALRASSSRVVAAVGEASEGEPPYRAAVAVAERLGTQAVVFPGDHGGFGAQPEAFAAKLHQVLSSS
jgi:hypothetical protein